MTRSIRNFLATHNLLAVAAQRRETAINTEQELDTVLLADLSSVLNYQGLKFPNREEFTGKEEADRVHHLGGKAAGTLSFSRAQPQHFAFLLAYGLGEAASTPAGASGYRHLIRPLAGEVDAARSNPSFTAALRFGRQVVKRRFASCFIDQVRVDFAKDGWAKITGTVKGTGKVADNSRVEELSAPYNAGTLTLAADGVAGEEDQARAILSRPGKGWDLGCIEFMGNLHHDSRAVAGFVICPLRPPVRQVLQHFDAAPDDIMGSVPLNVRHEPDAAGVVLVGGIIQPLSLGKLCRHGIPLLTELE